MAASPAAASEAAVHRPKKLDLAGAAAMLVLLPVLVYYATICVMHYEGSLVLPSSGAEVREFAGYVEAPTLTSIAIFGGWFGFQALCQILLPGRWQEGSELEDGSRLSYRLNGWLTLWVTAAVLGGAALLGWIPAGALYDEFGPLLSTVNIFTYLLCGYLYVLGLRTRPREASSGSKLYDYFMGRSLNPRTGRFDWKFFCESRPSLIGWVALDFALAAVQYDLHGHLSWPMILVCAFQLLYVADCFFHEEAMLSQFDFVHERFGWMLAWGDLAWVPFMYSLQALYLVQHADDLPVWAMVGIAILNLAGYYLFRSSNIQKHRFRADPERPIWGRKPEYIRTARGSLLLVSGWWGVGRHMNYLGDLMMALAWCLLTGFDHPLPYFYVAYLAILLVHREHRDSKGCAEKYGADWDTYCTKVRWRILPGVY